MHYRLLLIVGLLPHEGGSERVVALVGGVAVLPCSFGPASSEGGGQDVEWSRRVPGAAGPQVVFLFRDGCETFEMKSPDFEFRASLFLGEVGGGNLSLRLSGVRMSDAGEYRCLRLPGDSRKVELLVVAAPDPRLELLSAGGGQLSVRCEAGCWRPAPRVELLDHRGRRLPSQELRGGGGGGGGPGGMRHRDTQRRPAKRHRQARVQSPPAGVQPNQDGRDLHPSRLPEVLPPPRRCLCCCLRCSLLAYIWINCVLLQEETLPWEEEQGLGAEAAPGPPETRRPPRSQTHPEEEGSTEEVWSQAEPELPSNCAP
ncbi:butyrophilin-like protein 3 [Menidia menidia]